MAEAKYQIQKSKYQIPNSKYQNPNSEIPQSQNPASRPLTTYQLFNPSTSQLFNYLYPMLLDTTNAGFWAHVNAWDTWLFLQINREWTNGFLDQVFPWWRDANTWVPLYLFLLVFILLNFGWKAWPWILFVVLTATLTDQVSSQLFKDWFNRPRPCRDPLLMYQVRLLLNRCPSSASFTSSHAANHFGAACYLYFTLKPYIKKWGYLFFVWAATVSYGQVYVGVHYPLDILGGAVLGSLIGYGSASFFNRRIQLPALRTAA
jgi:undecaprenyl-diphosphatase